jgi:hypothetical protein
MVKLSTILAELLSEAENPNVYKFRGILITDTQNRGQTEILSDIRSIAGVTVATSKELPTSGDVTGTKFYKTELNLKIDPHPYKGFSSQTLKTIVNQIKQIEGVRNFSPIGNVQMTKPY